MLVGHSGWIGGNVGVAIRLSSCLASIAHFNLYGNHRICYHTTPS